jgi:hypothetical protein
MIKCTDRGHRTSYTNPSIATLHQPHKTTITLAVVHAMASLTGNLRRKSVGYFFDIGDVLIFSTTACLVRTESATAARPTNEATSTRKFVPENSSGITCDGPVIPNYVSTFWACVSNIFQTINAEWDQAATETTSYHAQECDTCSKQSLPCSIVFTSLRTNTNTGNHIQSNESARIFILLE